MPAKRFIRGKGERDMDKLEKNYKTGPGWAVLIAGIVILFTCGFLTALVGIDYEPHEEVVADLDFSNLIGTFRSHPEPLWHSLVYVVVKLTGLRVEIAAGIVSGAIIVLTFLIAYWAMRRVMPHVEGTVTALFCLILHLAAAIYVPWFNREPYLGQGSPNVWHNPTTIMVRPIALLVFLLVTAEVLKCREQEFEKGISVGKGILIAILLVLSCLAKPSFVQIFYPAILTLMVLWLIVYHRKNLKLALELLFVCVPSLIVMILQFIVSFYSDNKSSGGITIAPFQVAGLRTDSIPISLLLVTAFPLLMLVLAAIRKKVTWSEGFAWILYLWGLLWKLLLAETGERATHGNFTWGFILGLYLVWFVGIRSYLDLYWNDLMTGKKRGVGFVLSTIVLALHLISGVYYIIYLVFLGHTM